MKKQLLLIACLLTSVASAQSVCLPMPRLLTTMPMGGQAGSEFEVTVTGEFAEEATALHFSDPRIEAVPKLNPVGDPIEKQFVVSIAADCPTGVYEAALLTRLGLSASRAFTVGDLSEQTILTSAADIASATEMEVNSICNSTVKARAASFFAFQATKGQRVLVDCAARGIDSKLNPVVIVADDSGADLVVERRGGAIDFRAPEDGRYLVKVHDLTFMGGSHYFFRLCIRELGEDESIQRAPSTRLVRAFSWPPHGLPAEANVREESPDIADSPAQAITLPCDITGSFAQAADVDTYQFNAKKGEIWWVEIASERLGRPTDPTANVQFVSQEGEETKRVDVAQLSDIASPVKVSTNGYSYDGPPYNAGSSDFMGKIEIKNDGLHQIQVSDLFGGTRTDPDNIYRLVIRKAAPDFALVGWGLHMGLRNGDRNALSKPMALRPGATIALEVVAIRRDGFDGEIELFVEDLPEGVSATGLKIGKGSSKGMLLISADEKAPRGLSHVRMFGKAKIGDQTETRECSLASMAWPVTNHRNEIPSPRLITDTFVSVGAGEPAPLTIAGKQQVFEAVEGTTVKIPLALTRRSEFSGKTMSAKTMGVGFERNPAFDISLDRGQCRSFR